LAAGRTGLGGGDSLVKALVWDAIVKRRLGRRQGFWQVGVLIGSDWHGFTG
jgi:hypothetical protein